MDLVTPFSLRRGLRDDAEPDVAHSGSSTKEHEAGRWLKASYGYTGETCCRLIHIDADWLTYFHGLDDLQMRTCLWDVGDKTGFRDTKVDALCSLFWNIIKINRRGCVLNSSS